MLEIRPKMLPYCVFFDWLLALTKGTCTSGSGLVTNISKVTCKMPLGIMQNSALLLVEFVKSKFIKADQG